MDTEINLDYCIYIGMVCTYIGLYWAQIIRLILRDQQYIYYKLIFLLIKIKIITYWWPHVSAIVCCYVVMRLYRKNGLTGNNQNDIQ